MSEVRELYVIENQDGLIGKEVAYAQIEGFGSPSIIVTTDGGIYMWETCHDLDDEERLVNWVLIKPRVKSELFHGNKMDYMLRKKIITQDEFDLFFAKEREAQRKREEEDRIRQEERDRAEYERLQAKYGSK